MKSLTTPDFWNLYAKLPPEIKKQARKSYRRWQENQSYPSLHFKKVNTPNFAFRIASTKGREIVR